MNQSNADIRKTIGARIRRERIKRGLTIEKLAEKLDISPSFLGCVERGERSLSIENLVHISEFFSVTIDSLVKKIKSDSSRLEEMSLLIKELDDNQYRTVYKIAQTAKDHLKNSGYND
jgi:transcriptional regulator with XRE-family HTH domain